jgi:hypothetical protein
MIIQSSIKGATGNSSNGAGVILASGTNISDEEILWGYCKSGNLHKINIVVQKNPRTLYAMNKNDKNNTALHYAI